MASSTASSGSTSEDAATSTSAPATISPISLLALTTPFVPPAPSCASIFTTTSTITSYYWNNFSTTALNIVYSDPEDSRFTACQPPGWDGVISSSRFHFSPAVCPEQWTAYEVREAYVDTNTLSPSRKATTAYCCASGYSLGDAGVELTSLDTLACISAIGVSATPTPTTTMTAAPSFPNGVQIHNAYQISWDATDRTRLSPTPPILAKDGCSQTLSVWVPGESVSSLPCSIENGPGGGSGGSGGSNTALIYGLAITFPVVFVALLSTCVCIHYRNKRKGPWRPKVQAGGKTSWLGFYGAVHFQIFTVVAIPGFGSSSIGPSS
ncbi:hypothetical protein ONS95_001066 [Cadophora gregata]|uniref:uncharacterized protein n=1 Tax=Cadophora gregata TaxID=51156 RepID=UPI0026DD962E|nr:uncharacterized protein ONS95_001066 [Cadophora gregata]KAK0129128.1 hypothetical protein ONS95_001066 [Cadophora gregata]